MPAKPLVSIVIPFFNAERFIAEAINSVAAQTYEHWELLLVNDGSTDDSATIARVCCRPMIERVRYLDHHAAGNRGMSASRNLGISEAHGSYVAMLDADDVWLPNKLERQVAVLEAQPRAGMVFGTALYWYSWTRETDDQTPDFLDRVSVPDITLNTLVEPPTLTTALYPLGTGSAPCPSDLLFRRELVTCIGGFEEAFAGVNQMYEDQGFLAKVYLEVPVFIADECWIKYRVHSESYSAVGTTAGKYWVVRSFFLEWLAGYLTRRDVSDQRVWSALDRARSKESHDTLRRP